MIYVQVGKRPLQDPATSVKELVLRRFRCVSTSKELRADGKEFQFEFGFAPPPLRSKSARLHNLRPVRRPRTNPELMHQSIESPWSYRVVVVGVYFESYRAAEQIDNLYR